MKGKMYLWRGRCTYEGEDVFMKGKMYLWRKRCIYEGEDVFMKGKMYLWRGRCIYEGEDVFMKGKMYLWRGRCIYEGEDVFMKGKMCLWRGRCIYEGEDVFMKGKMYLWREYVSMKGKMYLWRGKRGKKNPGIFEGIENKMLFKNQTNSWNFSSQKRTNSGNFWKKNHNVTCGVPFLQKFPEFLDFLQLRVSTAQEGIEDVLAADSLETQYVPRFPSKNPGNLWGMVEESLRWRFRTHFLRFVVTDFMV